LVGVDGLLVSIIVENAAVTAVLAVILFKTHDDRPVQAPDHPRNAAPVAGVAVNVTAKPWATDALHVLPQLIAPPATVPLPVLVTVRVTFGVVLVQVVGVHGFMTSSPTQPVVGDVEKVTFHQMTAPPFKLAETGALALIVPMPFVWVPRSVPAGVARTLTLPLVMTCWPEVNLVETGATTVVANVASGDADDPFALVDLTL